MPLSEHSIVLSGDIEEAVVSKRLGICLDPIIKYLKKQESGCSIEIKAFGVG